LEDFGRLPQITVTADMHCVTRRSRFDNRREAVAAAEVMNLVNLKAEARHVMVHAENGYMANLPLED
jgi:DMSO/TMAO reductase YedYZ molybdopterin-dependent catalytic subunit